MSNDMSTTKHKVLVVDDEPEICGLLKLFLEEDFDVVTYTDPRQACAAVDKDHFDLVVSDIKMPHLNGLQVVQYVKSNSPKTEVVLITGHAQTDKDIAGARQMGAAGILFKPFGDPANVIRYLNQVVSGLSVDALDASAEINSAPPRAPTPSAIPAAAVKQASTLTKPTVMVVDDEEDLVDIVTMLLGDEYNVISFIGPQDAIDRCFDHDFKCIITDLTMPQMSGHEFIKVIRAKLSSVPILVMSGHSIQDHVVREAIELGAVDLLPKPFPSPESVRKLIKRYIK